VSQCAVCVARRQIAKLKLPNTKPVRHILTIIMLNADRKCKIEKYHFVVAAAATVYPRSIIGSSRVAGTL
jgi:hypothetical protein